MKRQQTRPPQRWHLRWSALAAFLLPAFAANGVLGQSPAPSPQPSAAPSPSPSPHSDYPSAPYHVAFTGCAAQPFQDIFPAGTTYQNSTVLPMCSAVYARVPFRNIGGFFYSVGPFDAPGTLHTATSGCGDSDKDPGKDTSVALYSVDTSGGTTCLLYGDDLGGGPDLRCSVMDYEVTAADVANAQTFLVRVGLYGDNFRVGGATFSVPITFTMSFTPTCPASPPPSPLPSPSPSPVPSPGVSPSPSPLPSPSPSPLPSPSPPSSPSPSPLPSPSPPSSTSPSLLPSPSPPPRPSPFPSPSPSSPPQASPSRKSPSHFLASPTSPTTSPRKSPPASPPKPPSPKPKSPIHRSPLPKVPTRVVIIKLHVTVKKKPVKTRVSFTRRG